MTTTTPAASGTVPNTAAGVAQAGGNAAMQSLAGNFDTFLQLLTTQLQNQNPLDPIDANQFTQELVQFAGVEQQVNTNTNLQTLISLQQTTEATSALQLVGSTVTLNGNTATLSNATGSPASWTLSTSTPATAAITITSATGQIAYTGTMALNAGSQSFTWDGKGNNGISWPDGSYILSVTANGANGQQPTVSTQVQGTISSVDISQNPPLVTVGGQSVPITQIVSISH